MSVELNSQLDAWVADGRLMPEARRNLDLWLNDDNYAPFQKAISELVANEEIRELNDSFWTIIPFGTGGRRGTMGVGPNRINDRTIGESARGLADYICRQGQEAKEAGCVIYYDTRHRSDEFARICAEVMAFTGVKVYLCDSFGSTPELSFAVRHLKTAAGVMITASHNPPSDNGFKAYWSDGGQVVHPQDEQIIECVKAVTEIRLMPLEEAIMQGKVEMMGQEVRDAYQKNVCSLSLSPERDISFVFTPLHGVGGGSIIPALKSLGFYGMQIYEPQAAPDGDFTNVPKHKPNPEDTRAMEPAVAFADSISAKLVIASDPDADRLGVACLAADGNWVYLTGNQVGVLLIHYTLERLAAKKALPEKGYVVRTVVSSIMVDQVAADYEVEVIGNLLVGFKHIAETIRMMPQDRTFLFGYEESIGYLRSDFVRDKDATQAAVYVCELAAHLAAQGKTLLDLLDELYVKYGYYKELQESLYLEGAEGSMKMNAIMDGLRKNPPGEIAGHPVCRIVDRRSGESFLADGADRREESGTKGNVLIFLLTKDGETRVTIRPSGTEPKIKHYVATSGRMDDGFASLSTLRTMVDQKANDILDDLLEIERGLAD